jgi:prepilin-type N-terminal cleavage/methylation domain-containing protein
MQAKRGFTLIELVAVIVLISIVAVVVGGPVLGYVSEMRSGAAAARLAADLRYAQRIALAAGLKTWVAFDAAGDRYTLYREDPDNPGSASRIALAHPLDPSTNQVQFGDGPFANVTIEAVSINATDEIEFDHLGVPADENGIALAAYGEITLSTGVKVRIQPAGGMVEETK